MTAETATTPVETKAPAEEPVKEEVKTAEPASVEKKSFFATFCGCLGGSGAPPADTDSKEPTKKDDVEAEEVEKEEVAEKAEA
mmetsp:Transcript_79966/g.222417  ORF Transcript_79966/g.222417 Transcript_79966/m.222417 type:complete len:83 (-) Transcript_79966:135-383(-)